ncbi:ATP-binding protein [Litorivicinus lipolyticus]|uniref:ATP-binding protein n=1 Tax=Litorivicinus lipolyticus TaxID=418701 RepID=UPI003B5A8D59
MSIARVQSLCLTPDGIRPCTARAQIQGGLPLTRLLNRGRNAASLRERIRSVIKGAGYRYPSGRVTLDIELARGGRLDDGHALPLALAVLLASDQITTAAGAQHTWFGELNLDGSLLPLDPDLVLACGNLQNLAGGTGAPHFLASLRQLDPTPMTATAPAPSAPSLMPGWPTELATWVLSGGHSTLVYGEPGVGKSGWSHGLCAHWPESPRVRARRAGKRLFASTPGVSDPWRLPVGANARQLAHWQHLQRGHVVALDDLPLHSQGLRDALPERMDLEPQTATLATANPCPCGWLGSPRKACRCNPATRRRWQRQLPPPLIDRFDLVARYEYGEAGPRPIDMRPIRTSWVRQQQRQGCLNAQLTCAGLNDVPGLGQSMTRAVRLHGNRLGLSGRAQLKCALVARTLADLAGRDAICEDDLQTAIGLRASPHEG